MPYGVVFFISINLLFDYINLHRIDLQRVCIFGGDGSHGSRPQVPWAADYINIESVC